MIGTEEAWALQSCREARGRRRGRSGAEIASAYGRLGTEVLLFEALDRVLPTEDAEISKVAERGLKKQGMEIFTGTFVENVKAGDDKVTFTYGDERGGRLSRHRGRPRPRRRGPRARRGGREAGRHGPDRGRRRAAHVGQGRLGDRRPRARPGARAQGLRRGHHRRRGRRRPGDAPDRVRRHPARDLLHAERGSFGLTEEQASEQGMTSWSASSRTAPSAPAPSTATARASSRSSATEVRRAARRPRRRLEATELIQELVNARARGRLPRGRADRPRPPDALRGRHGGRPRRRRLADPRLAASTSTSARRCAYLAAERVNGVLGEVEWAPVRPAGPGRVAVPRSSPPPRGGRAAGRAQGVQPLRWPDPFPADSACRCSPPRTPSRSAARWRSRSPPSARRSPPGAPSRATRPDRRRSVRDAPARGDQAPRRGSRGGSTPRRRLPRRPACGRAGRA